MNAQTVAEGHDVIPPHSIDSAAGGEENASNIPRAPKPRQRRAQLQQRLHRVEERHRETHEFRERLLQKLGKLIDKL